MLDTTATEREHADSIEEAPARMSTPSPYVFTLAAIARVMFPAHTTKSTPEEE